MDAYLDEYLNSVSSRQKISVTSLLDEVRVSKENLPVIANGLEDFVQTAPVFLTFTTKDTITELNPIDQSITDARQAISEMYNMSNLTFMLLQNTQNLLISEVAALEADLVSMGKSVENYGFILGQNAYNFSYLDTFSDDTGRDSMDACPDRAALDFGPLQKAYVNAQEGTLVLPRDNVVSYALTRRLIKTNSAEINYGFSSTSQALEWRSSVESLAPITSSLPEAAGSVGAQAILEYSTSSAAPTSEIRIDPYSDTPVQLVGVRVYKSQDDRVGVSLLGSPILLDQPKTFHIPMQSVARIQLILNQPVYNRVSTAITAETEYRAAFDSYRMRAKELEDRFSINTNRGFNHLMFMITSYFQSQGQIINVPSTMPEIYAGEAGVRAMIDSIKRFSRPQPRSPGAWNGQGTKKDQQNMAAVESGLEDYVKQLFSKKDSLYNTLAMKEISLYEDQLRSQGLYDPTGVLAPLQIMYQDHWVYRYSLGIQNVSVGVGSTGFRGFHVTKPLDSPGDMGEVSLKVKDVNYRDTTMDLDNSLFTSTEYSVSNKSNPKDENDWIPILPVDVNFIESERLYPSETGRCKLRFPADTSGSTVVYRNNRRLELPIDALEYDEFQQSIVAIRIPLIAYSTDDILTISYVPIASSKNVSFANYRFDIPPLTNAYDASGSGESFASTYGNNNISLSHDPYIDDVKVAASPYNAGYGMTTYQPITIKLQSGEIATNLTHYGSTDQPSLPTTGLYFIHTNRSITFNKPVNQKMTVFYQHIQNNVRVRSVLRCNSKQFVSPKVDSLQIKAKTRRANKDGV